MRIRSPGWALLFAAAALMLGGCAALPQDDEPAMAPAHRAVDPDQYRLGVGDRVRIDVYGEPDLSMDAAVDSAGQINYPLLGSLPAARLTPGQLRGSIREGLASGYLVAPDVRVTVTQYRPFYVSGQVRKAGAYPFVIGLTVEKAIALAGGLSPLASTRRIYVVPENSQGERLRVGLDYNVLPGDTLLVEEGLF